MNELYLHNLHHVSCLPVQDMQGLLAQLSRGVAVEMQPTESSDLIQQLDNLRQTSVMLLNKNQNDCWFNTQVDKHQQHALILK